MRQRRGPTVFLLSTTLVAAILGGCREEAATGPEVIGVQLAKPGAEDPEVTGADPPGAPQDTTLDVEVSGSGFDRGSMVQLTLGGVASEKVRTNSTRYRNASTLIANITIDADADVDLYDVEVTTASRKKGIGTEMFEVTEKASLLVRFVKPASGSLEGWFREGVTLDLSAEEQRINGRQRTTWIATDYTDFTLTIEPRSLLYDDRDPENDPNCETGYLTTILDEAHRPENGGSLTGQLKVTADWGRGWSIEHPSVAVQIIFAVDDREYLLTTPLTAGAEADGEHNAVWFTPTHTILSVRDANFAVRSRKLGQKGTWFSMERCLIVRDPPNGIWDFEVWVRR